jgi:hypothetical protein
MWTVDCTDVSYQPRNVIMCSQNVFNKRTLDYWRSLGCIFWAFSAQPAAAQIDHVDQARNGDQVRNGNQNKPTHSYLGFESR